MLPNSTGSGKKPEGRPAPHIDVTATLIAECCRKVAYVQCNPSQMALLLATLNRTRSAGCKRRGSVPAQEGMILADGLTLAK